MDDKREETNETNPVPSSFVLCYYFRTYLSVPSWGIANKDDKKERQMRSADFLHDYEK